MIEQWKLSENLQNAVTEARMREAARLKRSENETQSQRKMQISVLKRISKMKPGK